MKIRAWENSRRQQTRRQFVAWKNLKSILMIKTERSSHDRDTTNLHPPFGRKFTSFTSLELTGKWGQSVNLKESHYNNANAWNMAMIKALTVINLPFNVFIFLAANYHLSQNFSDRLEKSVLYSFQIIEKGVACSDRRHGTRTGNGKSAPKHHQFGATTKNYWHFSNGK